MPHIFISTIITEKIEKMSDLNKVKTIIEEDKQWVKNEKEALAATVHELEVKISQSPCHSSSSSFTSIPFTTSKSKVKK